MILIGLGDFYFEIEELAIQNTCKEVDLGVIYWQTLTSNALSICTWFFEKSSLKNHVRQTGFLTCKNQFPNWFLQINFQIDFCKSISKLIFAGYAGSKKLSLK